MKVSDLIAMLQRADPDKFVAIAMDSEGTHREPVEGVGSIGNDVVLFPEH